MIKVIYTDNWLEVAGHANAAPKGKDLVCAGISSIVESARSWFKKDEIKIVKDVQSNAVRFILLKETNANQAKLAMLVKQLQHMAKLYKKNIKICKGK